VADLREQILAQLDAWENADNPGDVFDATERMSTALRALVTGPNFLAENPTYLPQPWAYETIAEALGIKVEGGGGRG
jgi:hypothetical protein